MIAYSKKYNPYGLGTVFATNDDWGLVQNSLRNSNLDYERPADGWSASFVVDNKKFRGKGWNIPMETLEFLIRERNIKMVSYVISGINDRYC